ncbi:MAG: bacteriophage abortive infection AbiH family protein [Prevotella sp.]|jgi:hypothetical protein|nr:bacteriophage abortive infection AbiH family protein [Prevotella sp.]
MNRIILIGNGFDLAHGLKTSYKNFIDDYWTEFAKKYLESSPCEDEFVKLENTNGPKGGYETWIGATYSGDTLCIILLHFLDEIKTGNVNSYNDLKQLIEKVKDASDLQFALSFKNNFWKQISEHVADINWAGIEHEYYERLRKCNHEEAEVLNKELKQIEKLLEKYLSKIEKEVVSTNKDLFFQIYSPLHIEDFIETHIPIIRKVYRNANDYPTKLKELNKIFNWILNNKHCTSKKDYDDRVSGIHGINLFPKNVCFLNFNYTDTTDKYYKYLTIQDVLNTNFHHYLTSDLWREMCKNREIVHIHGELNNPKNPIIFGYGDELAKDYKEIEERNDNEYLRNVKSIRYLDTANYRKMLSFIESEPYQIFIMGHSCGNSDRTLLNILFEHENCVSIKPFYYKKSETEDNYNEIVQNISRCFTNKAAMRERVVNRTFCEPLVNNR